MKKIKPLVLLAAFLPGICFGDDAIYVHNGFFTASGFRELAQSTKQIYSMGLIDGILLAPLYGADKEKMVVLESCIEGMSGDQIAAIFDKYIQDHPERWHGNMHAVGFSAMKQACEG